MRNLPFDFFEKIHAYYNIGGIELVYSILYRKLIGIYNYEESIYESAKKASPTEYPKIIESLYYLHTGCKDFSIYSPRNYTEKIQWVKAFACDEEKSRLTDKYRVREWVSEKIGTEYLIPLLGVWNSFQDIVFEELPNEYVLKSNTGSGWLYFVKNGVTDEDKKTIEKLCEYWKNNYAFYFMELQYQPIKPIIIAEEFIGSKSRTLEDYKFLCFNGKPYFFWIDSDRYTNHKRNVYDLDWNLQPWNQYTYGNIETQVQKPENFEKMIDLAATLSEGFSHVRVDLYNDNGKIYFGEMTFTNGAGYEMIYPEEYNKALGDLWHLPPIK